MADAWLFPYTDFGESHDALGRPVLRASFRVGVPGRRRSFSALSDTGGPVTVAAHEVIAAGGGDPIDTGERLPIRLGGRSFEAPLFELTLEARPPDDIDASPITSLDSGPYRVPPNAGYAPDTTQPDLQPPRERSLLGAIRWPSVGSSWWPLTVPLRLTDA